MTELLVKTRTYLVPEHKDFRIDIVSDGQNYEAYIYNTNYGVKMLMFGAQEKSYKKFLEIVKTNIPDYVEDYRTDYMD